MLPTVGLVGIVGLGTLNLLREPLWSLHSCGITGISLFVDLVTLFVESSFSRWRFSVIAILFSNILTSFVISSMSRDFILGIKDKPFESINNSSLERL